MRSIFLFLGWIVSLAIAFFAGLLVFGGDYVGWNYADDSYREMKSQRDALAELVTSRQSNLTDQTNLENILRRRGDKLIQKGFEYTNWEVSSSFGLYKTSPNGNISEFCFSDVDAQGVCQPITDLDSYVTLRTACDKET